MQLVHLLDRSDDPFDRSVDRGRPQKQTDMAISTPCVSPLHFDGNRVFKKMLLGYRLLPFFAGLKFVKWANNFYKLTYVYLLRCKS